MSSKMWISPSTPRLRNHTAVMGPKSLASPAVPRDWTMNRAIRMPAAIGTIKGSIEAPTPGASCTPSMADRTEMAGVMMPSP